MSKNTVIIYEDWAEVGGAVWYKWRLETEKEWNWKKTALKQKPVIYIKTITKEEYKMFYGRDSDE